MSVPARDYMLTVAQVAEMLYIHGNTVKRISDRGELPFFRVNTRGDRRYKLSDVQAYVARMNERAGRRDG